MRDALVRELRARGETEEAKAVAVLGKAPVGLWIANQLARLAPAEVKALIEATARLLQGQSSALERGGAGAGGAGARGKRPTHAVNEVAVSR